jgi:hypothetical protein
LSEFLRPYLVYSPSYETYSACYDPPEPPEYGADCVEVEAKSKREAVIAGVKLMLQQRRSFAQDNLSDRLPPWAGIKAELAVCGHGYPHFQIVNGKAVYQECWGCNAASDRFQAEEDAL